MKRTLIAICGLLILSVFGSGCFNNNNLSLVPYDDGTYYEKVVSPATKRTENKILMLDVDGIITEMGKDTLFYSKEATTYTVRRKLDMALNDPSIKAVILRVNSPGGGVNASDVVYREIQDYKARAKVPVVTIMMGVAASGGYYISCATDKIIAHPATVTGSIGVISMGLGFDGLFEKIGMESRVTKSGKLKDMGNPFDEWTDDEKKAMQTIVDQMFDRFVDIVSKGRNMKPERVREIADGRVVTAGEAKELGLIDEIGYVDDVIYQTIQMAGIDDANVIMYLRDDKAGKNIYTSAQTGTGYLPGSFSIQDMNVETLLEISRPRLMYMWIGQ